MRISDWSSDVCSSDLSGSATWRSRPLPLIGRVSMDLTAFDANDAGDLREGDWLALDYDLPSTSARSGLSQYELLTGLGARCERRWAGSEPGSSQTWRERKCQRLNSSHSSSPLMCSSDSKKKTTR